MRALGLSIAAALIAWLGFSVCRQEPMAAAERATVYLADRFHGHTVTIEADDALIFTGRVSSNDAIQYAATIPLRIHARHFTLRIRADDSDDYSARGESPVILEQKIDCEKGPYLWIALRGDKLVLIQYADELEFY
ncbi:hypothetical protein [Prosthecobacter sp.]|uniref:hypothetical protein n=1 Tax=Prosthecobacter sp. TaxID=1965333 RepID=UPI00378464EE